MANHLQDSASLIKKIEEIRDEFVNRFSSLVNLAKIDSDNIDRNCSAIVQYQMQTETAHLIRAGEDVQILVRQLQEMWLFGQLNTIGESEAHHQADENAEKVSQLLEKFTDTCQPL
ncbi:hypothetical protein M433DRAFT_2322 [Acidomyces richmondensis BFW]|nr:MAG: hypothetical protein FE78DRAFT_27677 [Acidomyces sp. 'richmondensis']KYG48089.1 hypothetical protein M433DRAFT_2322 [Acidomyces richmondensis BFW]